MKKLVLFLLLALLIFGLVACSWGETTYERTVNGETYVINRENNTVTHDGVTYRYWLLGIGTDVSSSWTLTITYPDGSWYRRDVDSNGRLVLGSEQTSDDYDGKKYPKGEDMCYALEELTVQAVTGDGKKPTQDEMIARLILGLFFICVGALTLIFPGLFHQLKYALWVKDAEPTDFAIGHARFAGVVWIIIGIGVMIFM